MKDPAKLPSLARYEVHLEGTMKWLVRSFAPSGGSRAYAAFPGIWSRTYPETTGYIIPTLLNLEARYSDRGLGQLARRAGNWLLSLQRKEGAWAGGLEPSRNPAPASVFNTGQILLGLCALADQDGDSRWLDAASRAAAWLAGTLDENGLWPAGDYRATESPSYYTHVSWPMLEVWKRTGDPAVRDAAMRFLDSVLARRCEDGAFARWGFSDSGPAYTHTIAYTLCGLVESALLLGSWEPYGSAAEAALERLRRRAEISGGSLPGAFADAWKADGRFVCLTGNAQIAILLLRLDQRQPDLRLVNAAAKLVDRVCDVQLLRWAPGPIVGAVGGSFRLWGPYMRGRYPNWAAKYHADSLGLLIARLAREV